MEPKMIEHYPNFCPICAEVYPGPEEADSMVDEESGMDAHSWDCPNCGHHVWVAIRRHHGKTM